MEMGQVGRENYLAQLTKPGRSKNLLLCEEKAKFGDAVFTNVPLLEALNDSLTLDHVPSCGGAQTRVKDFHFHIKVAVFFVFVRFDTNDEMEKSVGPTHLQLTECTFFVFWCVFVVVLDSKKKKQK